MSNMWKSSAGSSARTVEHIEVKPMSEVQNMDVSHITQAKQVRNKAFAAALIEESPRPFRRSFLKLYVCLFFAYMCSSTNGFDGNTFGGLSAEPDFKKYFDLTPANQGATVALYTVGQLTACLFAGPLADKWGRRFGMAFGSVICVIGAIVQASATGRPTLMGGRFILGMGTVLVNCAGPAYVVEMAYPKYRGFLTGLYQAFFFTGTIATTWLEFGLSYLPGDSVVAWRLPLALQAVPSLILLSGVMFIPETPRWWMGQGNEEKAREILIKYHGDGNPNSAMVALEMEEMAEVVSLNGSDKRFWDFRDLFNTKGNRYRTYLLIAFSFFSELELPPTSYYLPLMVTTIGITNTKTKLLLNALQTPIMMVSSLCGLSQIDKYNRRTFLIYGSIGMSFCIAVITACTARYDGHPAVSGAGIAFLYIFLVIFAFTWVPNQALYPSEILPFNNRAKGLAFYNLWRNMVLLINNYVPPVAVAAVSWRFYIFYILFDALGAVVVYFFFIETRGWNLEEIEGIFNSDNPKKESLRKEEVAVVRSTDVESAGAGSSDLLRKRLQITPLNN